MAAGEWGAAAPAPSSVMLYPDPSGGSAAAVPAVEEDAVALIVGIGYSMDQAVAALAAAGGDAERAVDMLLSQ